VRFLLYVFVIVISRLLNRHLKVKCRASAYLRVRHQIRGIV